MTFPCGIQVLQLYDLGVSLLFPVEENKGDLAQSFCCFQTQIKNLITAILPFDQKMEITELFPSLCLGRQVDLLQM